MTKRPQQDALSSNSQVDKTLLDSYAQEFGNSLLRYFLKRGAQKATAEDLTQNVFIRLAKRAAGGEIENAQAYLMQTASSVWKDHLKKRQRQYHSDHREYEESYENIPVGFSPKRVLEGREAVKRIVELLDILPKRSREVFILRRIEGMSRKEVAESLSISLSAVDQHLMVAMARIGKHFGDYK
jgi:RNA polymerase sigma-70 factor (ECF subfamily)